MRQPLPRGLVYVSPPLPLRTHPTQACARDTNDGQARETRGLLPWSFDAFCLCRGGVGTG